MFLSDQICDQVCAKYVLNGISEQVGTTFIAVPGSHTLEFLEEVQQHYGQHYPSTPSKPKTNLNSEKPDPLGLFAQFKRYIVPPYCLLLWNSRILHGHEKNHGTQV